jgi:hypothetical protein
VGWCAVWCWRVQVGDTCRGLSNSTACTAHVIELSLALYACMQAWPHYTPCACSSTMHMQHLVTSWHYHCLYALR